MTWSRCGLRFEAAAGSRPSDPSPGSCPGRTRYRCHRHEGSTLPVEQLRRYGRNRIDQHEPAITAARHQDSPESSDPPRLWSPEGRRHGRSGTRRAIEFQRANNLHVTGELDAPTLQRLTPGKWPASNATDSSSEGSAHDRPYDILRLLMARSSTARSILPDFTMRMRARK